jgi:hypothetical protein
MALWVDGMKECILAMPITARAVFRQGLKRLDVVGNNLLSFKIKEMIGAGLVVGLATSLATICLYENTGNLQRLRADSPLSSVARIEARVDCAKDEEQKSWRKFQSNQPASRCQTSRTLSKLACSSCREL